MEFSLLLAVVIGRAVVFRKRACVWFATINFTTFKCIRHIRFGDDLAFAIHANTKNFLPQKFETYLRIIGNPYPYFHHVLDILQRKPGKVEDLNFRICRNRFCGITYQ
ncbi:hypothetical protein BH18ACT7_BH18ACT7_19420 [soil metagenome]